jgi:hypothetical protein
MRAPRSLMDAIPPAEVSAAARGSAQYGEYGTTVDRESAYERLTAKIAEAPPAEAPAPAPEAPAEPPPPPEQRAEPGLVEQMFDSPAVKSFLRSAGSALAREITRGMFGTRRRRR